ncbi:hypothetical protein Q674_02635 [Acinetobacter sp. COS3]|nr:hypothetical protein Q674_02635 [Acinetobacter sp. COS3]
MLKSNPKLIPAADFAGMISADKFGISCLYSINSLSYNIMIAKG